jgi:dihydroneopterin aldolase
MSDVIFVTGLLIHAHHGVMEHESRVGQRFVLDLELSTDLADAARSDKLADTVSYASIVETATAAFSTGSYKLVEAAAGAVADAILATFPRISSVRVTVHKPHAPIAATFTDVGVTLLRSRRDSGNG